MKISIKKLVAFLLICGLLLVMAGCGPSPVGNGGGGGGNGPIGNESEIKNAIDKRVNSFREAVERYDVDGMLAFLDKDNFELTIAEGGNNSTKPFDTLEEELIEDEEKQLHWRDPVPEGHGYVLTMEFYNLIYDTLSSSGARLIVEFYVWEKADDPQLPQQMTDKGNIVCEMVSLQGEWLCRVMTINFKPITYGQELQLAAAQKGKSGRRENRRGFCFGKLDLGE